MPVRLRSSTASTLSGGQVSAYYNGTPSISSGVYAAMSSTSCSTRPITSLSNLSNTDSGHGPAQSKILQMMRDDLIEHYPAPYPLDIMPVRKVQQEVQQVLGSLGVDTPPVDRVIRISDDGTASIHATWPRVSPRIVTHLPRTIRQAFSSAIPTGMQIRWTGNMNLKHSRRITGRLRVSPTVI